MERRLTRGLEEFKWFIYRFTSPTMKRLFATPRNVLAGGAGGDLDAGRRCVRRPEGDLARCASSASIYAMTAIAHRT